MISRWHKHPANTILQNYKINSTNQRQCRHKMMIKPRQVSRQHVLFRSKLALILFDIQLYKEIHINVLVLSLFGEESLFPSVFYLWTFSMSFLNIPSVILEVILHPRIHAKVSLVYVKPWRFLSGWPGCQALACRSLLALTFKSVASGYTKMLLSPWYRIPIFI